VSTFKKLHNLRGNTEEKQAELGDSNAMFNYGSCLAKGRGIQQNLEESVYWYKQACTLGNSSAMADFGRMLLEGKYFQKNIRLGISLLKFSSKLENMWGSYWLICCRYYGIYIRQNREKALKNCKKIRNQNNNHAYSLFGLFFFAGLVFKKSYSISLEFFDKLRITFINFHLRFSFIKKPITHLLKPTKEDKNEQKYQLNKMNEGLSHPIKYLTH
jgi:TPR repeat protein